jgi:IS66 Orf2 like protein
MIALQSDVRVYLACGYTDMRKGMQGLAMLVQQVLAEDPFNGALYAFRGEDCQRNRPTIASNTVFMITGTGVHDPPDSSVHNQPEWLFTIDQIQCSRSTGTRTQAW